MAAFPLRKESFMTPEVRHTIFLPDLMYDDICKETEIIKKNAEVKDIFHIRILKLFMILGTISESLSMSYVSRYTNTCLPKKSDRIKLLIF